MNGPLARHGGAVYQSSGVSIVNAEARSYLAACNDRFDLIQLPLTDAFGATGAGLHAGRESYLYTVEALALMLSRLTPDGVLAVTRWARTPPRDDLRAFDTAAGALRRLGLEPAQRLAMLRNWATVTVLAFRRPVTPAEAQALRRFCRSRGFDLCYLPGLPVSEANQFHVLERPYYYEAAAALLGDARREFLDAYPFQVRAPSDDWPYFYHVFRWRSLPELVRQAGARSRAFLEMGYVLNLAALVQTTLAAAVLILLPLVPRTGVIRRAGATLPTGVYVLAIGAGFMVLEVSLFQQFIRYLGHPVLSAAAVISSFLVWGGVGSLLSRRCRTDVARAAARVTALVATLAVAGVALLPGWLGVWQGLPFAWRLAITTLTIAPLATAMGHAFPLGLRWAAEHQPALTPWLWGANGFASVVATAATPVLSMACGFRLVGLTAALCYALAAASAWRLTRAGPPADSPHADPTPAECVGSR